jgi:hypothetical protein
MIFTTNTTDSGGVDKSDRSKRSQTPTAAASGWRQPSHRPSRQRLQRCCCLLPQAPPLRIPLYLLPEEGLYFPPLLAADIENPDADVKVWMGNEAILRVLHAEGKPVGWTTDPDGDVHSMWWKMSWSERLKPYKPRLCRDGFKDQTHWDHDLTRDNGELCAICLENQSGVRFVPCGHKVVCICCFTYLAKDARIRCSLCRKLVVDAVRDTDPRQFTVRGPRSVRQRSNDEEATVMRRRRRYE